ncbi:MAG: hypothetical protein IPL79_11255 [Myxococcales bacterium]|nr:hypothetical protein [Myxococcales bacterium]
MIAIPCALLWQTGCQNSDTAPDPNAPAGACKQWSWEFDRVDQSPISGYGASIAVTADRIWISSIRATGPLGDMMGATKLFDIGMWKPEQLSFTGSYGDKTDLVVGDDGLVYAAFHQAEEGYLRIATQGGDIWTMKNIQSETARIGNIPGIISVGDTLQVAHADGYNALTSPTPLLFTTVEHASSETRELVNRGGTLSTPTSLDVARHGTTTGIVYAFTDGQGATKGDLSFVTLADGGEPVLSTIIEPSTGFEALDVHLASTSNDGWLAVFGGNYENEAEVEVDGVYRAVWDGEHWSVRQMADIGACHTSLAVDANDEAFAVATQIEHGTMTLSYGPAAGEWLTEEVEVPQEFGALSWPSLAIDAQGRLHAAFLSYQDGETHLVYGRGTPTPKVCEGPEAN